MAWLEKKPFFRRRRFERKEFLGLPNYLTYGRIAAIPVIVFLLMSLHPDGGRVIHPRVYHWDHFASFLATVIFIVAALSDVVDGYYARRYNFTSSFGKFLDPLADKLLSTAVLILLIPIRRIAAWVVLILISREIAITTLRAIAADEGIVIAASRWGKYKTVMENFALGFFIYYYPALGLNTRAIANILIVMTILLSLGSGIHYIIGFFREVFAKGDSPKGISS
ncbi:MAG: CDP-diacylglycerol--glycerol-3-phosphate 3-phosphatidyltransferase [Deltaproteobacteria bacterium]|nr:CDP-diacylglycerol--glycerol-3-phosphate 3-phosphatidyltransferase [Deltaproteobacteria bacterium]